MKKSKNTRKCKQCKNSVPQVPGRFLCDECRRVYLQKLRTEIDELKASIDKEINDRKAQMLQNGEELPKEEPNLYRGMLSKEVIEEEIQKIMLKGTDNEDTQ